MIKLLKRSLIRRGVTAISSVLAKNKLSINIFLTLSVLSIGVIYIIKSSFNPALYFAGAILLAAIILILRIDDPVLRNIILVALFVRLGLALIQSFTMINFPGAGSDSIRYEKLGWEITQSWFYGTEYRLKSLAMAYSFWIGLLYSIAGRLPLIPKMANILFSLVTLFLIYKSVLTISNNLRAARISALLLLIIPSINIFSAILLRESMLMVLVALSFYLMLLWIKNGWLGYPILAFLTLAVAGIMHGVLILLMWVYVLLMIFYSPKEKTFKFSIYQVVLSIILIVFACILINNVAVYQLPINLADIITPDYLRHTVERKSVKHFARTTYLLGLSPHTYFDLLWQTPIRVFYLIFTPFPWLVENLKDLLGSFEAMFYIVLYGYGIFGFRALYKKNKYAVISAFLIVASMAVMYAWGTANYGTAWRHRQKLAPFVVIFSSAGIASSTRWKRLLNDKYISGEI